MVDKITALGKELGHELRMSREKAGYNAQELAQRLGWSPTTISRVENGARTATDFDLTMYLASCGAGREEIKELLALAKKRGNGYRVIDHTDNIYDESRTLLFHEQSALTIDAYEPSIIPPLLQTESYTRALLIESGVRLSTIIEHRMESLARRQATLRQSEAPQCTFFIHQNALNTIIGDNLIMSEQLSHLAFLATWRRWVIRLVPTSAKATGLAKNSFQRITFSDQDPLVTIDLETNTLILDNKSDTTRYRAVLNRLDQIALNEENSRTAISDAADDLDGAQHLNLPAGR